MKKTYLLIYLLYSCTHNPLNLVRVPSSITENVYIGPEITFTNRAIKKYKRFLNWKKNPELLKAQKELKDRILELCQDCTSSLEEGKHGTTYFKITYPDDFKMNITIDPNVVEVTTTPIPMEDFQFYRNRLNAHLYKATSDINLKVSKRTGGGHIHFDMQTMFKNDPNLFRNFIVDFYNHPELTSDIFYNPGPNAPHMRELSLSKQRAFKKVIQEFDSLPESSKTILKLSRNIFKQVYKNKDEYPSKYQA